MMGSDHVGDENFAHFMGENDGVLEEKLEEMKRQLAEFMDEKNVSVAALPDDALTILLTFIHKATQALVELITDMVSLLGTTVVPALNSVVQEVANTLIELVQTMAALLGVALDAFVQYVQGIAQILLNFLAVVLL